MPSNEFRIFVEKYNIFQWASNNTENLISAVEQAYKAELKKQEAEFEKLATINADIAKSKASNAAKSASESADAAADYWEVADKVILPIKKNAQNCARK